MKSFASLRLHAFFLPLSFVFAFFIWGGTPLAKAFEDVSVSNAHYAAISTLVTQGVVEGYSDGSFRPDQEVNRAEALKIILVGMGLTAQTESKDLSSQNAQFSDVRSSDWFYAWVTEAVRLQVVKGYNDGSFKPGQTVTRAEAMKMVLNASGLKALPPSSSPFPDVKVEDWFAAHAQFARTQNALPPQTDGLWHPQESLTRGELAELVMRLQVIRDSGHSFDEATHWGRIDFSAVNVSMKVPFGWWTKQDGVGAAFLLDTANGQLSLLSPEANGGTLLMTRYANYEDLSVDELFDQVRETSASTDAVVAQQKIGGFDSLVLTFEKGTHYREWYIALPNGSLLHLMALRGEGAYAPYLEWYFNAMVASLEFEATPSSGLTRDDILEQLRLALKVDGVGAEMKALVADWELFETDSIGVGTGPVDYFYSPSLDVTLKYERSFDVLLDLREGKTSAF